MFVINVFILLLCYCVQAQESHNRSEPLLLTPLIKLGHYSEARNASLVDPELFLGVESYSGFLTVDERYNSNLFFWYFPVTSVVEHSPWLVWLQGGPGASSLTGLFDEIGPFTVDQDWNLKSRFESWGKDHSLLFIDNPVGTGYSFTDSKQGYAKTMPTYGSHLYTAVQQFLQVFPELRSAPLFVAGESYAGKYVPALAMQIHEHRSSDRTRAINLQGLIVGNGVVEREMMLDVSRMFYNYGLIDLDGLAAVKPVQDRYIEAVKGNDTIMAHELRESLLFKLETISHQWQAYNILKDDLSVEMYVNFLGREDAAHALHVGGIQFKPHNATVAYHMVADYLTNARPLVVELLEHYRILLYCGQLDLILPCVLSSEEHRSWRWSRWGQFAAAVRFPWTFEGKIAGYAKSGGGLTEVMVRGAGHLVPLDVPAQALDLVTRFTQGMDLPGAGTVHSSELDAILENSSKAKEITKPSKIKGTNVNISAILIIVTFAVISIVLALLFILWRGRFRNGLRRLDESNVDMVELVI